MHTNGFQIECELNCVLATQFICASTVFDISAIVNWCNGTADCLSINIKIYSHQ